jgi:TM2 domain-containing membrane protein YozV
MKNRNTAIALAFFFGGFGVQRFYVGQVGVGIVSVLFAWTFIPAIVAIVDIIRWIGISQDQFAEKYA